MVQYHLFCDLETFIVRGDVQMMSAKFLGFFTPSLPQSELVIFSYTPFIGDVISGLNPPPQHCVQNPAFYLRSQIKVSFESRTFPGWEKKAVEQ